QILDSVPSGWRSGGANPYSRAPFFEVGLAMGGRTGVRLDRAAELSLAAAQRFPLFTADAQHPYGAPRHRAWAGGVYRRPSRDHEPDHRPTVGWRRHLAAVRQRRATLPHAGVDFLGRTRDVHRPEREELLRRTDLPRVVRSGRGGFRAHYAREFRLDAERECCSRGHCRRAAHAAWLPGSFAGELLTISGHSAHHTAAGGAAEQRSPAAVFRR